MARTRARRSVALLTGLACLVALAGCNSNPSPSPLPSSSPSATPSESPSLTRPTIPAEAQGTSEASAKAFVRYWVDTLNYAGSSGDTEQLRQISGPECESCSGIIDKIDRVYSDGGYFKGAGWSVQAIDAVSGQPRERPILQVGIFVAEQEALEQRSGEVQYFEGGRKPTTFRLKRDEGWTVTRIDQVQ